VRKWKIFAYRVDGTGSDVTRMKAVYGDVKQRVKDLLKRAEYYGVSFEEEKG
jgi:hypothetical protein